MNILITGGCGFIGSAFIKNILKKKGNNVFNFDKLTYSSNPDSLNSIKNLNSYKFYKVDICNFKQLEKYFNLCKPDHIVNFAAQTHVDRSIDNPKTFIETNICGTFNLLEVSRKYFSRLNKKRKKNFKFLHVSTDEVYGDLKKLKKDSFTESSPYQPNSPYSASKASSDHLVRAWIKTYKIPAMITNCSNNFGPYQHPEKLIPHIIIRALLQKTLPIYGNGKQIRDWIFVNEHCRALYHTLLNGRIGETYLIGSGNSKENIWIVKKICNILDKIRPLKSSKYKNYSQLIKFVDDRPGHDEKYSINSKKIKKELKFRFTNNFLCDLTDTVQWYCDNVAWWNKILKKEKYNLERIGNKKI